MALPGSRSRADDVVTYVEDAIEQRKLRPGDLISTRAELREETGVAKATVNEAVRLLQERRRIVPRPGPGGGLFVADADPVVHLGRTLLTVVGEPLAVAGAIEVREQLEPLVAAHAAQNRSAKDKRELTSLIAEMAEKLDDAEAFVLLNWQLHERIAAISPNVVLRNTYIGLYEFVNHVSKISPQPRDIPYMKQRLDVHSDLVAAIIAGDVISAQHAAALHRHPG